MKVITPTLTCFPKKSACSKTLAKCSLCVPGEHPETAADIDLWNRTGNTEKCGGHEARTVSVVAKTSFRTAGLTRNSGVWQRPTLSHLLPRGIWRDGMKSSVARELSAPTPASLQDFTEENHLCSCNPDPARCPLHPFVHLSHTHTLILAFLFPAGRRHLIWKVMHYCHTFAFEVLSGF